MMHVSLYTYLDKYTDSCIFAYILYMDSYLHAYVSHRGVFWTIKSLLHALGASSSMTMPTINSTLLAFIEQVNIYDLQKMVLQFAIYYVPTLGYTYMVYTLYN